MLIGIPNGVDSILFLVRQMSKIQSKKANENIISVVVTLAPKRLKTLKKGIKKTDKNRVIDNTILWLVDKVQSSPP